MGEAGAAGRRTTRLVLASILCVYAGANAAWLALNGDRCVGFPFHARHFLPAMDQYDLLKAGTPLPEFIASLREDRWHPAPLHSFAAALGFLIAGKNVPLVAGVLNLAYFALALLFLPRLASELGYPREVGVWAMALFSLYPAVYGLSRLYGAFDFQVMALMPAAVWCVLKTRGFESRRWTLVLAAVTAAGLLLKDTFAGYFGPVLLLAAASSLRRSWDRGKAVNLLLLAVMAGAAVSFYYACPVIVSKELTQLGHDSAGPWHRFWNWRVYTIGLSETIMSPLFLLLFIGALARMLGRGRSEPGAGLLAAWVLAPWAVIFFMPHFKQPSYFAPILPAAAIVSAAGLRAMPPRPRWAAMAVLAGVGIFQFAAFSFSGGGLSGLRLMTLPNGYEMAYFRPDPGVVYSRAQAVPFDLYEGIAARIAAMSPAGDNGGRVLVLQPFGNARECLHLYSVLNWLRGHRFCLTGDAGMVLQGSFLRESYDRVIIPLKEGWDGRAYAREVHRDARHGLEVSKAPWTAETRAALDKADPEWFGPRLERFLAPYTEKTRLGHDGEADLWLLSRPPGGPRRSQGDRLEKPS